MKKWFIRIIIICVLLLAISIYIFIPAQLTFSESVLSQANSKAAYRCLTDKNQWQQLFGKPVTENTFNYNGAQYIINEKTIDGLVVHIKDGDTSTKGVIRILPLANDSSAIVWESSVSTGLNPVKKMNLFFYRKETTENMAGILENIKHYLNKEENLYDGLQISKEKIKDRMLIALKSTYKFYPDYESIYETINKLQQYATQKGAHVTNYTMLNITKFDSADYQAMVAIPISKEIKATGNMELKNLILGNILVTKITGGTTTILNAEKAMENYLNDHGLESPGIPYQSLITNRVTEKDTTKWITKLNYPVY